MGGKSTDNTAFGNTGERSATDKRFHAAVAGNADRGFCGPERYCNSNPHEAGRLVR